MTLLQKLPKDLHTTVLSFCICERSARSSWLNFAKMEIKQTPEAYPYYTLALFQHAKKFCSFTRISCLALLCISPWTAVRDTVIDSFLWDRQELVKAFSDLCKWGHLDAAKWFVDRFQLKPEEINIPYYYGPLGSACLSGNLQLLAWLTETLAVGNQKKEEKDKQMMGNALTNLLVGPHYEILEWFMIKFDLKPEQYQAHLQKALTHILACNWKYSLSDLKRLLVRFPILRNISQRDQEDVFSLACSARSFNVVRFLERYFSLRKGNVCGSIHSCMYFACRRGHLKLVQWLCRAFGLTKENVVGSDASAFNQACRCGHFQVAFWLTQRYSLTVADIWQLNDENILHIMCEAKQVDLLYWLVDHFRLTKCQILLAGSPSVFSTLCECNKLKCLKWLTKRFALKTDNIYYNLGAILSAVATSQSLRLAKWLVKRFHVSKIHLTWDDCRYLEILCRNGSWAMLRWSIQHFRLTRQDLFHVNATTTTLYTLLCYGHVSMAEWLCDTLQVTRSDLHLQTNMNILARLCTKGRVMVVKWLIERFSLSREEIRDSCACLRAIQKGHFQLARWLVASYPWLADEKRQDIYFSFETAYYRKEFEIAKWIAETHRISLQEIHRDRQFLLAFACEKNLKDMAKWMVEYFKYSEDEILALQTSSDHPFCRADLDETVKWLLSVGFF